MEHNEYAVWKMRVRHGVQVRRPEHNEMVYVGDAVTESEITLVAPKGELGRALIDLHLKMELRHRPKLPGLDITWEYTKEPKEEQLDAVIRFDNAYRGRM